MSARMKVFVVTATLLALLGAGVGAALAQGTDDAQAAAKNLPAELQPMVDRVKAALEQLKEPAGRVRDLMQQVKENRGTIRDLVDRIGRDNLADLEGQLRQLARDMRDDRAVRQEARQIKQGLKNSQRQVRTAVRAGDIEGAKLVLEQDLAQIAHSSQVLEQAAQAIQTRVYDQNALIEELRVRTGS